MAFGCERLADAAEKLLHETERLRRDITNLNNRITPYAGMEDLPPLEDVILVLRKWKAIDALNMIEEARKRILNCEYEVSAIRGRADAIEADAVSREEMKPWIKSQ
jgi:hypothetical protein